MAYTKTTWVNGETPINADNLNKIENQLETNTNDINALNTYSTSEQRIGTWINGKPIYRKTFVVSITGHYVTVGNIPNLDIITSCNSYLHRDGDEYHSINNWGKNDQDYGVTYRHNNDIAFDSSYKGTLYITLEYTKTTD